MNEVKYGPGDEQTWPAFAGHPNDPRNNWNGEEETDTPELDDGDWEDYSDRGTYTDWSY